VSPPESISSEEEHSNSESGGEKKTKRNIDESIGFYLSALYDQLNVFSKNLENTFPDDQKEIEDLDAEALKTIESTFDEWMGSFYNILIYLLCTTIAFLAGIVNPYVRFLPIAMFIIFPGYLYLTFIYSIPELKVDGEIVFSRKDLTFRRQIRLARSLFSFFLRQLYENSKRGLVILAGFLIFLLIVLLNEYFILTN